MTGTPRADADPGTADVADRIAAVVRAVPGVADLHPGMFGELGTYLPGRVVPGVRVNGPVVDVHVTVYLDADIRETAARVRHAVAQQTGGEVDVTVEDVVPMPTPSSPPQDNARLS